MNGRGRFLRSEVTRQALRNVLARLGTSITEDQINSRNVAVVIVTAACASITLIAQIVSAGGAVAWHLVAWTIPGVLIGGQIGPRLQGRIAPHTMRRAIAILFVILGTAMMGVAWRKAGL